MRKNRQTGDDFYPSIFVRWDNSPRRGEKGIIILNSSARLFEKALKDMVERVLHKPFDERLVFISSWNEWAEGNHLEPDLENGLKYLNAVARVNAASPIPREK
jgi:hypothetical protein